MDRTWVRETRGRLPARGDRERGITLVEVVISTVVLAAIVLLVASTLLDSQAFFAEEAQQYALDQRGRALMARIADELRESSDASLLPLVFSDSSFVVFQKATAVNTDGSLQLGSVHQISFDLATGETADGLDNNGDGLIDEGAVHWTDGLGPATLLAPNAIGLRINRVGSALDVAVDLAALHRDGRLLQRSFRQTIVPRN